MKREGSPALGFYTIGIAALFLVHRVVLSGRWKAFSAYCAVVGLFVLLFLH